MCFQFSNISAPLIKYSKPSCICGATVQRSLPVVYCCRVGSSMNDVTVLRGRGQGFCDGSTKALVLKSVTMREMVSRIVFNCIHRRPQMVLT